MKREVIVTNTDGKTVTMFPIIKQESFYDFYMRVINLEKYTHSYIFTNVYLSDGSKYDSFKITSEHPFNDTKIGLHVYDKMGQRIENQQTDRNGFMYFDLNKTLKEHEFNIKNIVITVPTLKED